MTITFGEGLGNGTVGIVVDKCSRGLAPGERASKELSELRSKFYDAVQFRAENLTAERAELEEKSQLRFFEEAATDILADHVNEEELLEKLRKYVTSYVRKNGSIKAVKTRVRNVNSEVNRSRKIESNSEQKALLSGSRWFRLMWKHKNWKGRVVNSYYEASAEVFEVVIVNALIAFARVRVFEEGSTEVIEPKWINDHSGRLYHLAPFTRNRTFQAVGQIGGKPVPHHEVMAHFQLGILPKNYYLGQKSQLVR